MYLFLAAWGLSCGMKTLSLQWEDFSLVVIRGLQSSQALQLQRVALVAPWHVGL